MAMAMAGDLNGVARVYENVGSLVRFAGVEEVEEEMEASVSLLDACAAARDSLRAMRACALDAEEARRLAVDVLERVVTTLSRRVASAGETNRWSACVARAFTNRVRRVACEDDAEEIASLSKLKDERDGGETAAWMRTLGETIEHLEDGVELLFRRIVQCRVFLLNMCSS
uniref:Uncharacterized protein n=1 Tax=Leersia perrieri TaxID=77586 RepID=A0A0D9XAM3_9ORYZ